MPLELRDAIYLSAVHSYFLDVCNAEMSLLQRIRATMNILHDCGYTLLRDALDAVDNCSFGDYNISSNINSSTKISLEEKENFQSTVEELKVCITSFMEDVKGNEVDNRTEECVSCVQLFCMHSCRLLLSNNTNITVNNLALSFFTANAEFLQGATCVRSNTEWIWWNSLIASVSTSEDTVNNKAKANTENVIKFGNIKPLFIPVFINNGIINEGIGNDLSKENVSNYKKDKQTQHNSKSNRLIYTYNCARLYSALLCAMNAHAGTVTEMSKLLIIYIFQQELYSKNGPSGEMHNKEISDWLALCVTRVKGVVAGVIEHSLMCSRAATHCTINALDELANSTADSSTQPSTSLESSTLEEQEEEHESKYEKMESEHNKINDRLNGNVTNKSANHKIMQEWEDGWLDKFAESSPHYTNNVNMTLQMAAITLTRLVEQCELLVNTLKAGDSTYANSCVSNWLHELYNKNKTILGNVHLRESIAIAVTHAIQELLYTLVLGRSTEFMSSRPDYTYDPNAQVAINNKQRDIHSSASTSGKHTRSELFKPTSVSSLESSSSSSSRKSHSALVNGNNTFLCDALSVVTSRGLCLAEADGLLLHLFPTVLQQTGYEWPWSALLKQLRALDKEEQVSHYSSDNNKEILKTGNVNYGISVRWSSRCVIEMLLLRLATAFTYPARLANILPSSYDRIIDSIGLFSHPSTTILSSFAQQAGKVVDKHKHNNEDNISVNENGNYASVMFDLPAYYKEAATPVLSYICSAASRVSVHEVERILIESTSALPMTARLRTLVGRTSNDTYSHNTYNNYLHPMEEEQMEEEEEEEDGEDKKEVEMLESSEIRTQANTTTTTTTIARLARELRLPAIRVNGWEWRYRLEVLMSVLIVYTQLATPSALQQLIRTLQPLIASAYTSMRDAKLTEGVELIARTSANRKVRNVCFNREAQVLINYVGYQFYTLEWLPMVAHVYHTSLLAHNATRSKIQDNYYNNSYSDFHSTFITPCVHPYSVAAAMAHQFDLHIKSNVNTALSSLNTLQQHQEEEQRLEEEEQKQQQLTQLPIQSSQESTMTMPLNNFTSLAAFVTASIGIDINDLKHKINHESNKNSQESSPYRQYERVHRFFDNFIHACFLVSLTSPCELEGPLAVSATRKIGSHTINEVASSSAYAPSNYTAIHSTRNYSSANALSILRSTYADVLNARCYRQWCKAAREVCLSSHRAYCGKTCCRVDDKCNTDETKGGGVINAEASANVKLNSHDDTSKLIKGAESVERIGEALLHFGAHSFSDVLQASDGLLACLQCFLPSSVLVHEWASSLNKSNSTNKEMIIMTKKKKQKDNIDVDKNKVNKEKFIDSSQFNVLCADILQNAAWQWCESTLVPYSQSNYLLQSLHNIRNNNYNADNNQQANKHNASSFQHSVTNSSAIKVSAYNSCTFDVASLSREIVRRLLHQLLTKMQERLNMQKVVCKLHQCHHSQHSSLNFYKYQNKNDNKDACKVNVDPFLLHQWRQLRILLHTLALCNTESPSSHANNTVNNSASLSALTISMTTSQAAANANSSANAAYYMWHSPYFVDEFKFT